MKFIFLILLAFTLSNVSFATSSAESLSLEDYLKLVKEQNLDFKIEQTKSDLSEAKTTGLSIPAPMVGLTQMKTQDANQNTETASGFEISQTIPFPTKLTNNHTSRKYDYQSQLQSQFANQKQILLNAKNLYYTLWQKQARLSLLEDKKNILIAHIKLSKSTARSDSFTAIHVLKTEADLDALENEIESEKQLYRERKLEAAALINADPATFKILATEPKNSSLPQSINIEESHAIKAKKLTLESLNAKESEAKSEWLPDFNLKYKETGATSTTMKSTEVMVGVTLPFVFFWEPNQTTKQANYEKKLAEYDLEKEKRRLQSQKIMQLTRLDSLKKQIEKLSSQLIPKAEKRMKLVLNITPRDLETLQDHRDTMEALPELKIKLLDLKLEYELAISDLERLTANEEF